MTLNKIRKLNRRKNRIRTRIQGKAERPRLTINRSNKYLQVQLIDDQQQKTLLAVTDKGKSWPEKAGNKTQRARQLGQELAKKAQQLKISLVVFDRKGYKYHGRVKALAEGAREGGLQF